MDPHAPPTVGPAPRARCSPAARPAGARSPPRCWRGGGGCSSGSKPAGGSGHGSSPNGVRAPPEPIFHRVEHPPPGRRPPAPPGPQRAPDVAGYPAAPAPGTGPAPAAWGKAGVRAPAPHVRAHGGRRSPGTVPPRRTHLCVRAGGRHSARWLPQQPGHGVKAQVLAKIPGKKGKSVKEGPARARVPIPTSAPVTAIPRCRLCSASMAPVPSGHPWRGAVVPAAGSCPLCACATIWNKGIRGRRIPARPALARCRGAMPAPAGLPVTNPRGTGGTGRLAGHRCQPCLASHPVVALQAGTYLPLLVRSGSSRMRATRLWWCRESWQRDRQRAGSWGEREMLWAEPSGRGAEGGHGAKGSPPCPGYLLLPVPDALQQAVQEMLQFGQGLAAQHPVKAEEGEEGDESQAGTVGIAARLGDHAQCQELEGEGGVSPRSPRNPPWGCPHRGRDKAGTASGSPSRCPSRSWHQRCPPN